MQRYRRSSQSIPEAPHARNSLQSRLWGRPKGTLIRGLLWLLALWLALPGALHAKVYNVKPGDKLFDILKTLKAGDEVIVQAGTYQTPGFLTYTWNGTKQNPIVIRAASGARPLIKGVSNQNVMNLNGSYFTMRGFEITSGSHGLRLYKVAHIVLEDLKIHDTKSVGISCNAPTSDCDDVTIRRNEIYKTAGHGEGMYLGCNNAACVMRNSVIEQNYIHDLGGSQGDGIEMKSGSFGNVVRDNVIVNARYPAITMYGFQAAAGRRPNVVERNLVWKTVDNGIQIVGQVIVRNNIIVNAGLYGIHSKPSQGFSPHSLQVVHNTIVNAGQICFKTNNWSGQKDQIVANNVFYCPGKRAMDVNGGAPAAQFFKNAILGSSNHAKGTFQGASLKADLGDPANKLLYPPTGSKLLNAGNAAHSAKDDFDGRARSDGKPDVGAYERSTNGPGWKVAFGFKPPPANDPLPPTEPAPEPSQERPGQEPPPVDLGSDGGAEPPIADTPGVEQGPVEQGGSDQGQGSDGTSGPDDPGVDAAPSVDTPGSTDGPAPSEQAVGDTTPQDQTIGPDVVDGVGDSAPKSGCGCESQEPSLPWTLSLILVAWLCLRRRQSASSP